jgi:hypothetical protein
MLTAEELKEFAKNTLKSESATGEEKAAAKKAISRVDAHKANKADIAESCGRKPTRKAFAPDEDGERLYRLAMSAYWDRLDARAIRKQAEKVLNDKDATPLMRHNARARLETLDGPPPQSEDEPGEKKDSKNNFPTREDFGFLSGLDWPEFVESGKEAQFQAALETWRKNAPPPSDPKIAAFLNSLNDESVKVTQPALQPATPKVPTAPPTNPALYCESCRVPFSICGCNTTTCPLCLNPRSRCYFPCQNTRRR